MAEISGDGDEASSDAPAGETGGRQACELLSVLGRLKHYVLRIDRRCGLLAAQRTSVPFERIEDVGTCFAEVERVLADIPRKRFRLLVDARSGPLRNDPGFEAALAQHRGKLLFGFAKNAALVASAGGVLQVHRFARADRRRVFATSDPAAAFEYLGLPVHPL